MVNHFHQGLFAVAGGATDHSLLDHFTFFGSTFLVMPNAINVRQTGELFATFEDNPVVVTTVGCLCVTYVLVVISSPRCLSPRVKRGDSCARLLLLGSLVPWLLLPTQSGVDDTAAFVQRVRE